MDDNMIKCPKCGHDNDSSSEECDNCGVTLSLVLGDTKKAKPRPKPPPPPPDPDPQNMKKCPKCGTDVVESSTECIKCGIIFAKYFEVKERVLRETLTDLDRSVIEETSDGEVNQEVASEKEKVQAELEKAEAEKEKPEEKEPPPPAEKPAETKPEEAADKADLQRIAQLEKKAETLRLQTAALKKEKQEYEKTEIIKKGELELERQDVLQKAQEAQTKLAALEGETQALKKETEALKKEKEDLEAEAARRKEQDEKEAEFHRQTEAEEQAQADALEKERQDAKKRTETILKTVQPKPTMKELLKKYEGEAVGINFDDPAEIKSARLAKVNEDHFSIMVPENELVHSYPYNYIVSIVEGVEGVPIDAPGETPTFPVVIRMYHLNVKKKWGFI
ncbi:MAG: zinc ribbon domain-containing protein [Thermodesulfobacteriota bacterium]